jgi:hypothetical protein
MLRDAGVPAFLLGRGDQGVLIASLAAKDADQSNAAAIL